MLSFRGSRRLFLGAAALTFVCSAPVEAQRFSDWIEHSRVQVDCAGGCETGGGNIILSYRWKYSAEIGATVQWRPQNDSQSDVAVSIERSVYTCADGTQDSQSPGHITDHLRPGRHVNVVPDYGVCEDHGGFTSVSTALRVERNETEAEIRAREEAREELRRLRAEQRAMEIERARIQAELEAAMAEQERLERQQEREEREAVVAAERELAEAESEAGRGAEVAQRMAQLAEVTQQTNEGAEARRSARADAARARQAEAEAQRALDEEAAHRVAVAAAERRRAAAAEAARQEERSNSLDRFYAAVEQSYGPWTFYERQQTNRYNSNERGASGHFLIERRRAPYQIDVRTLERRGGFRDQFRVTNNTDQTFRLRFNFANYWCVEGGRPEGGSNATRLVSEETRSYRIQPGERTDPAVTTYCSRHSLETAIEADRTRVNVDN